MTKREALNGKPYAGNPHVRFDEGEAASTATSRRGALLYKNQKYLLALATACALSVAFATGLPTDGLQAHFRADQVGRVLTAENVAPKHGEEVSSWATEPGAGTPLTLLVNNSDSPLWQENAFQRADGTSLPAVRFGRNADNTTDRMNTFLASEATTLGLDKKEESTWFIVMKRLCIDENTRGVFGFYAKADDNNRFGAFFTNGEGRPLRAHNNANPKNDGIFTVEVGKNSLIDSRGSLNRMTSARNGIETVNIDKKPSKRSSSEPFWIGKMTNEKAAPFDCAELAVYNRALNDAEVIIIRNALAARWGLMIENQLWTGAAAGFCDDLAGIGSSTVTGDGRITGAVNTSASSGGLVLSVASGSLDGTDGYLLAAHDGKPAKIKWSEADGSFRITRTWRTASTLSPVPAVTFAFDLDELGVGSATARLLYRADASSSFADTGINGVLSGSVLSFNFAEGEYKDGEWMLAIDAGLCLYILPSGGNEVTCENDGGKLAWTTEGEITTLARSWYIKSSSANSTFPALRFNFLLGELEDGEAYAVYCRAGDTAAWVCLPYPAEVANGTVCVNIPAGLVDGYFTLGKVGADEAIQMPCAAVSGGLAGWYRADTGVSVVDGAVSVWRNLGLLGAIADVTKAAGRGSATPSTSVFSEGGVSFDGSAHLQTVGDVQWPPYGNDNTLFAVFKLKTSEAPSSVGVFGSTNANVRLGAFFTNSGEFRLYGYSQSNSEKKFCAIPVDNMPLANAMIVDAVRKGSVVDTYLNGLRKAGTNTVSNNRNESAFMIGGMADVAKKFNGDIAEIRVYGRAVSDVERNIVANHLAARYGVTMDGNSLYNGAAAGCTLDVVGIGRTTKNTSSADGVHVASNITVSENSAGLVIAAAGSLADGDYVLAGHGEKANGWISVFRGGRRMKRAWHITKTNALTLDIRLTFNLTAAGIKLLESGISPKYKILHSADKGSTWDDIDVRLTLNGPEFTCTIPAEKFAEGQYTLGADVNLGFTIVLR